MDLKEWAKFQESLLKSQLKIIREGKNSLSKGLAVFSGYLGPNRATSQSFFQDQVKWPVL
jgi:hypothetical protein